MFETKVFLFCWFVTVPVEEVSRSDDIWLIPSIDGSFFLAKFDVDTPEIDILESLSFKFFKPFSSRPMVGHESILYYLLGSDSFCLAFTSS